MSSNKMFCFIIISLFITINGNLWDEYHRQIDDKLPSISWKESGISVRNCDPKSTFVDPMLVSTRISGGEYAQTGDYPWFVTFYITNRGPSGELHGGDCGGAILNEWWVITARHCVGREKRNLNHTIVVKSGSITRNGGRKHIVERVVLSPTDTKPEEWHKRREEFRKLEDQLKERERNNERMEGNEDYKRYLELEKEFLWNETDAQSLERDIALLKVKNRFVPIFNGTHYIVNSISIPKAGIMNTNNESLVIYGLGNVYMKTKSLDYPKYMSGLPNRLKKGLTIMLEPNICGDCCGRPNTSMICYQRLNNSKNPLFNSSSEAGDSGSPQHQYEGCRAVQISLVSNSYVYTVLPTKFNTRVSLFTDWIRSTILSNTTSNETNETPIVWETNTFLVLFVISSALLAVVLCAVLLFIILEILTKNN